MSRCKRFIKKLVSFCLGIFLSFALAETCELDQVARMICNFPITMDPRFHRSSSDPYAKISLQELVDKADYFAPTSIFYKSLLTKEAVQDFLVLHFEKMLNQTFTVLYPFSGADFLYPDRFFPNMNKLICIACEHIGKIPSLKDLADENVKEHLTKSVHHVLLNLIYQSYLITARMKYEYKDYGALLTLAVALVLAGCEITDYEYFNLSNLEPAVKIFYKKGKKVREVVYIQYNLLHNDHTSVVRYLNQNPIDTAFLKATSFLTQHKSAENFNKILLENVNFILQTDTGIPWRFFQTHHWKIKLFGIYQRPFYSTQSIPPYWGYQKDLSLVYGFLAAKERRVSDKNRDLSWEGFAPFHLDYGGILTKEKISSFTTTLMYFERK